MKTLKHESTTQPGVFFWAEQDPGPGKSYGVVAQAKGGPKHQAHDDSFPNLKDADDIAQMLANGTL